MEDIHIGGELISINCFGVTGGIHVLLQAAQTIKKKQRLWLFAGKYNRNNYSNIERFSRPSPALVDLIKDNICYCQQWNNFNQNSCKWKA